MFGLSRSTRSVVPAILRAPQRCRSVMELFRDSVSKTFGWCVVTQTENENSAGASRPIWAGSTASPAHGGTILCTPQLRRFFRPLQFAVMQQLQFHSRHSSERQDCLSLSAHVGCDSRCHAISELCAHSCNQTQAVTTSLVPTQNVLSQNGNGRFG